jgi:hypothetical protein
MDTLVVLIRWEVWLFLFGLVGIVAMQLLTGRINTKGLFYGMRGDGSRYFSPERVQLLAFTLAGAGYYLLRVLENPTDLPKLSEAWLGLLGASNVLYLGGKAYSFLQHHSRP